MVNISERIGQFAADLSMDFINAGVACQEQLEPAGSMLIGGRNLVFRAMHDVYSMDGFEKWSKALGADLKLINELPFFKGVFNDAIRAAEDQKNLYYATLFIGSMTEFVYKDEEGIYRFRWPARPDGTCDWVKILYAIGNFFETTKFLQRYDVFDFSTFTHLANKYGAKRVFNMRLDDLPVLGTVFDRPKDLFVFFASAVDNGYSLQTGFFNADGSLKWDILLKVTSSTGKMVLIIFGKFNYNRPWFMVADVITQNASLFSLILRREKGRDWRFNHPEI